MSDDETALDDLIPDDFKPKNNTERVNIPLVRWRNAVRKISLARRFISNLQLTQQLTRGVDIFSIVASSLVCWPLFQPHANIYGKIQTNYAAIRPYGGIIDALEQVYNKEGIRGLFRGWFVNWLSFLAPTLLQGLYTPFLSRTIMRKHISQLSGWRKWLFVGIQFVATQMITIPLDFIADRMISQNPDTGEVLYSNSIDCMRKVYHQQGLGVFWNTHSWVIYLCDLTNQLLLQGLATLSPSLANSSVFSVFSVLCVSTPLMGLKARMNAYRATHTSPLSAVKDVMQHEGLIGFYKGTVTLLWMFPLSMLWARINLRLQILLRGFFFRRLRNRVEEKEFTRKVKKNLLHDWPM
jgi:hypothetical protein